MGFWGLKCEGIRINIREKKKKKKTVLIMYAQKYFLVRGFQPKWLQTCCLKANSNQTFIFLLFFLFYISSLSTYSHCLFIISF